MSSLEVPDSMRLLPEETMGVMRRLEWLARRRMQGTLTGKHTSPDKGFSVEFAEHRPYAQGDELRRSPSGAGASVRREMIVDLEVTLDHQPFVEV